MEVRYTVAGVVAFFNQAKGAVFARVLRTKVDHFFAVLAAEAEEAGTRVVGVQVDADGAVLAGRREAFVDLVLAHKSVPAFKNSFLRQF